MPLVPGVSLTPISSSTTPTHLPLAPYLAARATGATHQEVSSFADQFPTLVGTYARLRVQGVTHADIAQAQSHSLALGDYLQARTAGASHRDLLRAARTGLSLIETTTALAQQISFREIRRSQRHKFTLSDYTAVRATGGTAHQVRRLAAVYGLLDLRYYIIGRQAGSTRPELLDALATGISLFLYNQARQAGATHREVAFAVHHNAHLDDYASQRTAGCDHTTALAHLAPSRAQPSPRS